MKPDEPDELDEIKKLLAQDDVKQYIRQEKINQIEALICLPFLLLAGSWLAWYFWISPEAQIRDAAHKELEQRSKFNSCMRTSSRLDKCARVLY